MVVEKTQYGFRGLLGLGVLRRLLERDLVDPRPVDPLDRYGPELHVWWWP